MASAIGSPRQHPILSTDVLGADGSHRRVLRVFCDVRVRSVSLDVCRDCPSCSAINGDEKDGEACVRCTPPPQTVPTVLAPAGAALHRGVVAVDETVLVRDVVALLVERRLRMLVVTDVTGRAQGIVHESQLLRQIQDHAHARSGATRLGWDSAAVESASTIMFPAEAILESIPLRTALAAMASAHQRQLLVVDEQGLPVGVLADVDALHTLHTIAQKRED